MIISRTPFRISLFGGGTDYPAWYKEHGGAVISTTIDKYCFITVRYLPPFFEYKHRVRYYRMEEVNAIDEIKHPSVRECLKFLNSRRGIEVVHHADLPAQSGLGSSSTFTVGLLHALYTLKNEMPTKRELAFHAINIEQEKISESVGSQDQVAAAFGGFNLIEFGGVDDIQVRPIAISTNRIHQLEKHMMLFFTGFARNAPDIARDKISQIRKNGAGLENMKAMVDEAKSMILSKSNQFDDLAKLLHEQWMIKRNIAPSVTNDNLDDIYRTGIRAGALGGKLLGAGGGGFMLFFVRPENQEGVRAALKKLLYVPFRFESLGSQIIYFSHDR